MSFSQEAYKKRLKTASEAMKEIRSGWRIVVGSGAGEPQHLVEALAERSGDLADAQVIHLMTLGTAPYAQPKYEGHLRHNALFIGANVREAVAQGLADYTPCFLSEIPKLMSSGRLPVDAALIMVAPPENGICSLGVSVDILKAAVENARYVVAQVNANMPWTLGDSFVKVEDIDAFVNFDEPLIELPAVTPTAPALWIGRYVAQLVNDGDTLQVGIGAVPDAVLAALGGKKDLGIHSEMISDGVLKLIEKSVVTGKRKTMLPGKVVASFCMGSSKLYRAVDRNPAFEFRPSDFVNSPMVIAQNERMVSINSALQVDLTGQVSADSVGCRFYSGVGGQVDFIRGASGSSGGRSIIALPSTANGGLVSRITAVLAEGSGVVTTRADVDFVVTEYGIASLKGKTIRERAIALISIAHPRHRADLIHSAKKLGFVDTDRIFPFGAGAYRSELETRVRFNGTDILFRPIKPSDERKLKELFYSQSMETTIMRFGIPLKRLSEKQFQELVSIDYTNSMAIAAFVREGSREKMIAVGRYYVDPPDLLAEAAFTVHDSYQGKGIGKFLIRYLSWIAAQNGLTGLKAEVLDLNSRMKGALSRCFSAVTSKDLKEDGVEITVLFSDLREKGNPAAAPPSAAKASGGAS